MVKLKKGFPRSKKKIHFQSFISTTDVPTPSPILKDVYRESENSADIDCENRSNVNLRSPKADKPLLPRGFSNNTNKSLSNELSQLNVTSNVQKLTKEQMNNAFEGWMKIAANNKINSKNTWNLDLIDYFSELSLLKEGDSINFQKASCTLDGCMKIYSSRIDSIEDETSKLLLGLSSDKPHVEDGIKHKSKKKAYSGLNLTLAKTDSINVKSFPRTKTDLSVNTRIAFLEDEQNKTYLISSYVTNKQGILSDDIYKVFSDKNRFVECHNSVTESPMISLLKENIGYQDRSSENGFYREFCKYTEDLDLKGLLEDHIAKETGDDNPFLHEELEQCDSENHYDDFGYNYEDGIEEQKTLNHEHKSIVLGNGIFEYFDLENNNPEYTHWRISNPRNPIKKTKTRVNRQPARFDFVNAPELNIASIFDPHKGNINIDIDDSSHHLLPCDPKITAKSFFSLFTHPNLALHVQTEEIVTLEVDVSDDDTEDQPGFDFNDYETLEPEREREEIHIEEFVQYEEMSEPEDTAIDIHVLKENILSLISHRRDPISLQEIVSGLKGLYGDGTPCTISPSLCFVAILHVTNDVNLNISFLDNTLSVISE